jgi:hypothetical protein
LLDGIVGCTSWQGVSCIRMCSIGLVPCPCPCMPIIPSPFFSHFHTPHAAVTRCWHMLLLPGCRMLHCCIPQHAWMDVWTVSPTVLAPRAAVAAHNTHTHRPSVHCPDRASAVSCSSRRCGRAFQRYSDTRPCRVPVADGARRGLTARHHTPRQLGLPPFHREPQRACRPGGPWRAGCRLPRCVTHYYSISLSHLALHTLLPSRPCLPIATKTTCSV